MNINDVKTEFGAYYLKNQENLSRLVKQINRPSVTDSIATPFFTDDTIYRASESRFTRVLQPFQKAWTPIGTLTFKPIAIEQFKQKIDVQEHPDDLEGTWLGFLAGDGIDRKSWPFIRWFIEQHVLPQAIEDYEMNEVYKGVFAAPTPGTAGAAGTAMNGLRKAINDNITAGRITPITMGAIPADDIAFVDYVEDFADQINDKYWSIAMQLGMNPQLARRFHRGYKAKYGKDTDYTSNTKGEVSMTNLNVIALPSMIGSNKIFCTPKSNMLKLGKKTQNMQKTELESIDRLIKLYSDWYSGIGFVIPEVVFTNDLDLV